MEQIFTLLIAFQIKHFLADYPFQTTYMLEKVRDKAWFFPLLSHAAVHAFFTLVIVCIVDVNLWWLALVDLVIHFTMDRIKASKKMLNRFPPDNKFFWWALGFDQMVHHLTHYFIIWVLVQ